MPPQRSLAMALFLGLLLFVFLLPILVQPPQDPSVPYSQFLADLRAGQVTYARVAGAAAEAYYQDGRRVVVVAPSQHHLGTELLRHGVRHEYLPVRGRSVWGSLLSALLPGALLLALLWMFSRQGGSHGPILTFTRSRAQLYSQDDHRVTMKDVAGLAEVKEELWEVVDFLRHPDRYLALGARIPRGILLAGPPGTGKTLLARAVAGEAGVPFFFVSGSDFVELFAGVGAARVRDLFERARQHAPCIVFIDEIDAVGRQRGVSLGGGAEEREQTLNQLLVEMDGFGPREGIVVMAATNRADILDRALLRPGRFDRVIQVDPPDRQGREEILRVHARNKRLDPSVDLGEVARLTVGFTGADLANLLNEAALLAARRRRPAIGMAEMEEALERTLAGGPERRRRLSHRERERVAFHEAGHAVVSRKLPGAEPVQKVTIIPRGRAGGYVLFRPELDRLVHSREEMLDRITGLLAGRAAEEVALGEVSTGAAGDLEQATELARRMVTEWGMDPELGPVRVEERGDLGPPGLAVDRGISERTAVAVDAAVRRLVSHCYQRAVHLLTRHRDALERVARALLERETLSGRELDALIQGTG
ncbi:MAG: ATP-dependent zinc metalloprotease FtsH [Bacillota bacterium]|nr:MAG: cell division protein FtsH [Bacillota bacterium]